MRIIDGRLPKKLYDQAILKQFTPSLFKLTQMKYPIYLEKKNVPKGTVNYEKLRSNIVRARNNIFELASCNEWELFVTLTLDPKKYDRSDLGRFNKDLSQYFRDLNKKIGSKIEYVLIPEYHEDKTSWHMHGMIKGLPIDQLRIFTQKDKIPKRIKELLQQDRKIYDWIGYRNKFGWVTAEAIQNIEALSKYITKYIKKDMDARNKELNAKLYYCSQGLKRAEIIKKGHGAPNTVTPDYENDWIKVYWSNNLETLEKLIY